VARNALLPRDIAFPEGEGSRTIFFCTIHPPPFGSEHAPPPQRQQRDEPVFRGTWNFFGVRPCHRCRPFSTFPFRYGAVTRRAYFFFVRGVPLLFSRRDPSPGSRIFAIRHGNFFEKVATRSYPFSNAVFFPPRAASPRRRRRSSRSRCRFRDFLRRYTRLVSGLRWRQQGLTSSSLRSCGPFLFYPGMTLV